MLSLAGAAEAGQDGAVGRARPPARPPAPACCRSGAPGCRRRWWRSGRRRWPASGRPGRPRSRSPAAPGVLPAAAASVTPAPDGHLPGRRRRPARAGQPGQADSSTSPPAGHAAADQARCCRPATVSATPAAAQARTTAATSAVSAGRTTQARDAAEAAGPVHLVRGLDGRRRPARARRRRSSRSAGERVPRHDSDPQADRLRHRAQLGQHVVGVVDADVGEQVAALAAGAQQLALDVDPVLGQDAVDRGQHARGVVVHVHQPVGAGLPAGSATRRQVDRQRGGALARRTGRSLFATNAPMSACASSVDPPMCGVRMTLGRPRSSETNSSPRPFGSVGKTSTAAPARCPLLQVPAQRGVVDDEAAADRLRNRLPRPHPGELLLAEEAAVAGPAVHVQRDHVGQRRAARPAWRSACALPSASLSAVS